MNPTSLLSLLKWTLRPSMNELKCSNVDTPASLLSPQVLSKCPLGGASHTQSSCKQSFYTKNEKG